MNDKRRRLLVDSDPVFPNRPLWLSPLLLLFFIPLMGYWLEELHWEAFLGEVPFHGRIARDESPASSLVIQIHADESISWGGAGFEPPASSDLPLLRAYLRGIKPRVREGQTLSVQAAADVRGQRIVEVLSAFADSGIVDYTFHWNGAPRVRFPFDSDPCK